jgi:hypothetical protein
VSHSIQQHCSSRQQHQHPCRALRLTVCHSSSRPQQQQQHRTALLLLVVLLLAVPHSSQQQARAQGVLCLLLLLLLVLLQAALVDMVGRVLRETAGVRGPLLSVSTWLCQQQGAAGGFCGWLHWMSCMQRLGCAGGLHACRNVEHPALLCLLQRVERTLACLLACLLGYSHRFPCSCCAGSVHPGSLSCHADRCSSCCFFLAALQGPLWRRRWQWWPGRVRWR